MVRPISALLLAALAAIAFAAPAAAQRGPLDAIFGTIFGEPPRPPRDVPGRSVYPPPDDWQRREMPQIYREEDEPDQPPQTRLPPGPPPSARYPAASSPDAIRSQPLPPPPGGSSSPAEPQQGAPAALPGLAPGQRQPRGAPPPGEAGVQPGDEVVTAPPPQKIENPTAVFAGLDKITGRIISFDVAVGETVQFGALQVTPRACYTRPPTETPNTDAFLEVDEVTLEGKVRRIFTGWMFATSPGLHAVEHPIYDVWLADCKKESPTVTAGTEAPAPPRQPVAQQEAAPPAVPQAAPARVPMPEPRQRSGAPPRR
jgi:hypothetical protein